MRFSLWGNSFEINQQKLWEIIFHSLEVQGFVHGGLGEKVQIFVTIYGGQSQNSKFSSVIYELKLSNIGYWLSREYETSFNSFGGPKMRNCPTRTSFTKGAQSSYKLNFSSTTSVHNEKLIYTPNLCSMIKLTQFIQLKQKKVGKKCLFNFDPPYSRERSSVYSSI